MAISGASTVYVFFRLVFVLEWTKTIVIFIYLFFVPYFFRYEKEEREKKLRELREQQQRMAMAQRGRVGRTKFLFAYLLPTEFVYFLAPKTHKFPGFCSIFLLLQFFICHFRINFKLMLAEREVKNF